MTVSASHNKTDGPLVVFIAGTGRSGSTLLGNALGEMSGCFHGGELSFTLGQFYGGNKICGCGQSIDECARRPDVAQRWCPRICGCGSDLRECGFWQEVQQQAFGSGVSLVELMELGRFSVNGMKYRPRSFLKLHRDDPPPPGSITGRYVDALRQIYSAVASLTDAETVVDSSKHSMHVNLAARFAGVRAHVIHLVRDPRAIAYSWSRRSTDKVISGPARVSMNWVASNLAVEVLHRRAGGTDYTFIRYEDFIRHPRETLEELAGRIGIRDSALPFIDATTLHMEPNHAVAGSPSRFRTGDVKLIPDDEWKLKSRARDRALATLTAAPFLGRYGYRFSAQ